MKDESYNAPGKTYRRFKHSVGISLWHFQWCTKYRNSVFGDESKRQVVDEGIRQAASEHQIGLIELNVQPEHVHCVAELPLTMAPSQALSILKGISSTLFNKRTGDDGEVENSHLWSTGKFAGLVGLYELDRVRDYVRNQEKHHELDEEDE